MKAGSIWRGEGSVLRGDCWLRDGRADDTLFGHAGLVSGGRVTASRQGATSPLGSGLPVLLTRLPAVAQTVRHGGLHEPQGQRWDNAPMESFWGTLKTELVHHRRFASREQARQEITEYIEIFYTRQRKQARLGYLSPAALQQQYYAQQRMA